MSDNLDFGTSATVNPNLNSSKLTVYGTQGSIPPLNPRFPNAYLTTLDYGTSTPIGSQGAPKLTIYTTIPTPIYPFTYIGTPASQNISYFGQINQANAPKISVYQEVQGTLVFSYNYTDANSYHYENYLPIITGTGLTIVNSNLVTSGTLRTVTVNISYIDNGTDFGLSFNTADNSKTTFYNSSSCTNLSISTLINIPLSRTGSQFTGLTSFTITQGQNPVILPNTSLQLCFYKCANFNTNISGWDTTNVTNMAQMFSGGWYSNGTTVDDDVSMSFNQNIGSWNTSNVTNMFEMFAKCTSFNQTLSNWKLNNVTIIRIMFAGCTNFNNGSTTNNSLNSLNNWNTSQVIIMDGLFSNCSKFNQTIGFWNTSNVTIMSNMFIGCTNFNNGSLSNNSLNSLNNWNTSQVTNMSGLFANCSNFNQTIGNWNTSNVTNMSSMFSGCTIFNQTINTLNGNWVTSQVTNMSYMFYNCRAFNKTLLNWNTSSVTNMSSMFRECAGFNKNLNSWTTSNVTDMTSCFNGCTNFNTPIGNWVTHSVIYTRFMFYGCTNFNQDIGNWNVTNVTSMANMFYGCTNFNQDIGNWNVTNVTNITNLFYQCNAFVNLSTPMLWYWSNITTTLINYANWHSGAGIGQTSAGSSASYVPAQIRSGTIYW